MSTSLKSASYFLQSIIDHMKAMTAKYKSFEIYLGDVKRKELEAAEFLEKIIMNRFRYEMAKKAQYDAARATLTRNKIVDVFLAVSIVVIGLATMAVLARRSQLFKPEIPITERVSVVAQALVFFVALIALYLVYRNQMSWENDDMNSVLHAKQVGEEFFIRFNNVDAIAIYHAMFLNFNYKTRTDNWEAINKRYNVLTKGSEDPEDDAPVAQLDIMDIVSAKVRGFDWISIIDACRPEYVVEIKNKLVTAKLADTDMETLTTQMELAELAKQENIIRLWDNNLMSAELQAKAKALWRVIAASTFDRETNIADIIKIQVVPLLVADSILVLKDVIASKPMALRNVVSKTMNHVGECLFELKNTPAGRVAQYDPVSRRCIVFGENMPTGFVLKKKKGSVMFVKRDGIGDAIVFVEGNGELPKEISGKAISIPAKTKDHTKECLDNASCVKVTPEPQPGTLVIAPINIPFKFIEECDKKCSLYRTSLLGLAEKLDYATYFNMCEIPIREKLINLSGMYDHRLFFMPHLDNVQNALSESYGEAERELVMNRVQDMFVYVDDALKKHDRNMQNLQYMTKDKFMNKVDDMTISQFIDIQNNTIEKLYRLVTTLQNNIQTDIANGASPSGTNAYINEERALANQRNLLYGVFSMTMLGYIVYIMKILSKGDLMTFSSVVVRVAIPFVCICLVLALLYAYYSKRRTEQDYNRDVLESNASKLIQSMFVLSQSCKDIMQYFPNNISLGTQLKTMNIPVEAKSEMYDDILATLRMLERCNLLTVGMDVKLPFPIIDISINIITMFVAGIIIMYLVYNIRSAETINQIKSLKLVIEKVHDFPRRFALKDFPELECEHSQAATIKTMGVVVFAVISMYFASKLLESSRLYKAGLYNSRYFAELKCVKK